MQDLWKRAREGCDDSLGELLEAYRPYLLAIANVRLEDRVRPKVVPSDIVQETIVRAHTKFSGFEGASDNDLRRWLRSILGNHLTDCQRSYKQAAKRDVRRELSLDDSAVIESPTKDLTPDDLVARNDQWQQLMEGIEELPAEERDVVRWYHEDDLTFAQIGERLGCSLKTWRSIWYRGLRGSPIEWRNKRHVLSRWQHICGVS